MAKLNAVELAAEMVAAFVSNNPLPKSELPALIHALHSAVERLAAEPESAPPQVEAKTPAVAQYREKWNLPSDYPMVAPNYAAQRSALAKKIGLGQIRRKAGARKSSGRPKAAKA